MAKELKYFYKTKDGKGWLADYEPRKDENLVEITKAEWDGHIASLHREPSAAQIAKREKKQQIAAAKSYLSSTDWIIVKIAEETDAEAQAALRTKYASEIAERKAKRELINHLEGELE